MLTVQSMEPMQRVLGELGWSAPALDFDGADLREQEPVHVRPGLGASESEKRAYAEHEALRKTIQRGTLGPGHANARLARHHSDQKRAQARQDALLRRTTPAQQPESGPHPEGPEYLREITLHLSPNGGENFKRKIHLVRDAARGTPGLKSLRFDEYEPGQTGRWFKATAAYASERARNMAPQHNFHVLLDKYAAELGPHLLTRYENDLQSHS